jgi:hypothetical protein
MGTLHIEDCGCRKEKKVFVSRCKLWKLKEPGYGKLLRQK